MSQTGILLGIEQLIDTIKCVDAFDESSSHESDEDLDLMPILMQTWALYFEWHEPLFVKSSLF